MKKKLIITGHDLGLSESINEGYEYVLEKLPNFISELSIVPNSEYSQRASEIAIKSRISTNLCICLTSSSLKILSKGSKSLTDDGVHLKRADTNDWNFSVLDTYSTKDIENEILAQYEWFLKIFGHKPSALVTQKGEHGDPKVLEPLMSLAKREDLPMRTPLWQWKANYGAQSLVISEGIKTTSSIYICLKDWRGEFGYDLENDRDKLITDINNTNGIPELLVMVGFCDKELFNMTSVSWQRGQIMSLLKYKKALIEEFLSNFEIVSYKDIEQ